MAKATNGTNGKLADAVMNLLLSQTAMQQSVQQTQATMQQSHEAMQQSWQQSQEAMQQSWQQSQEAMQQSWQHSLAPFLQMQAAAVRDQAEMEKRNAERFARIEKLLLDHSRVLAEHTRILEMLPEAVREKMGFKPPQKS